MSQLAAPWHECGVYIVLTPGCLLAVCVLRDTIASACTSHPLGVPGSEFSGRRAAGAACGSCAEAGYMLALASVGPPPKVASPRSYSQLTQYGGTAFRRGMHYAEQLLSEITYTDWWIADPHGRCRFLEYTGAVYSRLLVRILSFSEPTHLGSMRSQTDFKLGTLLSGSGVHSSRTHSHHAHAGSSVSWTRVITGVRGRARQLCRGFGRRNVPRACRHGRAEQGSAQPACADSSPHSRCNSTTSGLVFFEAFDEDGGSVSSSDGYRQSLDSSGSLPSRPSST